MEDVITRGKKAGKKTRKLGAVQQKILLLLLGGLALSCERSPAKALRIIRGMNESWKDIEKQTAERAIQSLYDSRLVSAKENSDGTITLELSENGKKRALTYQARTMKIERPESWDGKWRIIISDIPEHKREARDALRAHFEYLGFYILQKSAVVFPFDCKNEVDFLIEMYDARSHVRFIIADHIDNEEHLKRFFRLKGRR